MGVTQAVVQSYKITIKISLSRIDEKRILDKNMRYLRFVLVIARHEAKKVTWGDSFYTASYLAMAATE